MGRAISYCLALAACALAPVTGASGAGTGGMTMHADHPMAMPQHMPMQHHMVMQPSRQSAPTVYRMADYVVPHIRLVREDRKQVSLDDELDDGRPVLLNFVYTTCTETCPLTTHTFAALQDKLGGERAHVHMASISIDPEQDTPAVLARYAKKFGAGSQWHFYTGTLAASIAAQRAFNVYLGDKMDHNPVTFIRIAPDKPWLRIDGLATPGELFSALQELAAGKTWIREAAFPTRNARVGMGRTADLAGDPSSAGQRGPAGK